MSVASLKALIAAAGMDYFDCLELSELRRRAEQCISAETLPKPPAEPVLQSELAQRCDDAVCAQLDVRKAQLARVVRAEAHDVEDALFLAVQ